MVEGRYKSSHYRKVQRKMPGGRTVQHYRERKPKQGHCNSCQRVLHGVPRFTANEAKNMPKTMKRPERPYGGELCSRCMRSKITEEFTPLTGAGNTS